MIPGRIACFPEQDENGVWLSITDYRFRKPGNVWKAIDCVFTQDELEVIDLYKTDFQNTAAEKESLWPKEGGPTDEEWDAYLVALKKLRYGCAPESISGGI